MFDQSPVENTSKVERVEGQVHFPNGLVFYKRVKSSLRHLVVHYRCLPPFAGKSEKTKKPGRCNPTITVYKNLSANQSNRLTFFLI